MAKPSGKLIRQPVVQTTGALDYIPMSQKATTDQLNGKVPTGRKVNNKPLTADITLGAADVGTYTKGEIDTKVNAAAGTANNAVPNTRTVNAKRLNVDITLDSKDIFSQFDQLGTRDLNDVLQPGIYGQWGSSDATAERHYPQVIAGSLEVLKNGANHDGIIQRYTAHNGAGVWVRTLTSKIWSGWIRFYTQNFKPTPADVGVYTKSEVDTKVNAKANTGVSYTKSESDGKYLPKTDVLQATGQSTTQTMSQKVITDQLASKTPNGTAYTKTESDGKYALSARKVNGKPLTADVTLAAGDVNAYTKAEVDSKISPVSTQANKGVTDAAAANSNANNRVAKSDVVQAVGTSTTQIMSQKAVTDQLNAKVPTNRTINGKALSGNITISAGDVGAYSKTEVDNKIIPVQNAITNLRRGASVNPGKDSEYGSPECPAGCFLTRARHDPTTAYGVHQWYRPLQMMVNGVWKTMAGDA